MRQINSDMLYEITQYLTFPEIKKLGTCSKYDCETCKRMVPYSYY